MTAGFVLLLLAPAIWGVYVAFAITGLGAGLTYPGFQAAATLAVDESEQGTVAGLSGAANAGGAMFGPLVGTALYQFDPGLPYLVAIGMLSALAAFVWLNRRVAAAVPKTKTAPEGAAD